MQYRREIDGLRAIAVLPVLLFHAGFQLFSGGYIGVDIFFVISGYLITSIIINELEFGTFSIVKFYERRARRILPALFLVILVSLPFAWLWMSPTGLKDFSKSVVAVSLFLSNILFWKETGYFATANELKPLLHTWSLALEEQYYVLFPVFLMLAWRFASKRIIVGLLLVAALVSLAASQWVLTRYTSAAFYLLPTRGWELLIGALAAFYLFSNNHADKTPTQSRQKFNQVASLLGVFLIAYSIFAYKKFTPFPGANALLPTVGAVFIVLFANLQNMVGKILGSKWLVRIGLISYSTYLWHQPLFSFARYGSLQEPNKIIYLLLILLSLLLAFFTWKFVETPFRNKSIISRKQIFWFGLLGSLFFIAVGLLGVYNKGFAQRFNMSASLSTSFGLSDKADSCFDKPNLATNKDWLCDIGSMLSTADTGPKVMVFGDSHSKSLFDAFNEAAQKTNIHAVYSGASDCTPLLGVYILRADQAQVGCHLVNQRVFEYVKANHIKKVFLISRWSVYTDGGYDGTEATWIGKTKDAKRDKALSREAFEAGLKQTVMAYSSIGVQLYIVEQVPEQALNVQDLYYKLHTKNLGRITENIHELSVSKQQHTQLQVFVNGLFKQHAAAGQLSLVNFDDIFCDAEKCLFGTDKQSYYFDNNHLTTAGGRMVVDEIVSNMTQ